MSPATKLLDFLKGDKQCLHNLIFDVTVHLKRSAQDGSAVLQRLKNSQDEFWEGGRAGRQARGKK